MFHVAIIMDGNGRWASHRGLPRICGHHEGAQALRRVVAASAGLGITDLTVYAFSSDNWRRPEEETSALMRLLEVFLKSETGWCVERGVRVCPIGRRDRIPPYAREAIEETETATSGCGRLMFRIAIDYSSREAICEAARRGAATREQFERSLPAPPVDLLIRTAGEQRLSDFLLWECAYAEFSFSKKLWPDFTAEDLATAVDEFDSRERRFGGLPGALAACATR